MNQPLTAGAADSTGIVWIDATRAWLARFPLSILLLAGRIGVGATFFKAGLLKYNSFEFAVKLFQEEYRVPLLDPAVAARIAMVQELTIPILLFLGSGHADGDDSIARDDRRDPDFRLSQRLQRSSGVGFDPRAGVDARSRCVFARPPDRADHAPASSSTIMLQPLPDLPTAVDGFSALARLVRRPTPQRSNGHTGVLPLMLSPEVFRG